MFILKLMELVALLQQSKLIGSGQVEITGIETDSRKVKQGDLFICLPGAIADGHDYVEKALAYGAVAIVASKPVVPDVPVILVPDTRFAMAVLADHFFAYPSHDLKIIGITGTNGKTTTSLLIDTILRDAGLRADLMGTIAMRIGSHVYEAKNTTQEALELQRNLRKMKFGGAEYTVMEVSSHALELGRVKGVRFKTAIFTNLTQDHLDFHGSMEEYRASKGLFFSRLGNTYDAQFKVNAIFNADDPASAEYRRVTAAEVITYGIENDADVRAVDITLHASGTQFKLQSFAGEQMFQLQLIGKFNVYNALAAIAAALVEGIPLSVIAESLAGVKGVNGRFEPVQAGQSFSVVVDYAHTPDSLENVLSTIQEFVQGKIITVFGCGGDRDRTKRPIMGRIANEMSDYTIVTSDNPRTEQATSILAEIEQGIHTKPYGFKSYEIIEDRKQAIEKAIEIAGPQDVVLIAGKGHETYQEINGVRYDFDDRLVAEAAIRGRQQ
jgi:UDP-N-acetylmuramoyl-L-alanyl-D-glutamate--2,6-diaminopimelate ligase